MQKRILVAASMNGGAEVVAPVVHRLKARAADVKVLSYGAATATFRAMKVEPDTIISTLSTTEVTDMVRIFRPDAILTGTQVQDKEHPLTLEQMLWQLARIISAKSVAVLDTWGSYAERFSDLEIAAPGYVIREPLKRLPTMIAIMDEFARKEMLKLGFAEDVLTVTGNPYFEYTAKKVAALSAETREQLLAKPVFASFDKDAKLVVFLSDSWKGYPDIGFTEQMVLDLFLRTIDLRSEIKGVKINVIVRPHPFRNEDALAAFSSYSPAHVKAILHNPVTARGSDPANDYSLEELLYAADLVVGTLNNPIITAAVVRTISGRDTPAIINWVPNIDPKYETPPLDFQCFLSEQGITTRARDVESLSHAISDALAGRLSQIPMNAAKTGAIDKVIELL